MPEEPLVYIIILHWIHLTDTIECLESIANINYKNLKVVLINNDIDDFPKETERQYSNLEIINNRRNLGFAEANNQGIKKAISENADYVLILNNDTIVEKDFLWPLICFCKENPKSVVSPILFKYKSDKIENMGGKISFGLGICKLIKKKRSHPPDYLSGACFMTTKQAFQKIGFFDEDYFAFAEDLDWSFRARSKGYQLKIVHNSTVWHKHSVSTTIGKGWGPVKSYYIARNTILFAKKNLKGLRKWLWIIS